MFSKHDIEKELGKGINILPFIKENIKGNSINLTVSKYAWSLGSGSVVRDAEKGFVLQKDSSNGSNQSEKAICLEKGRSAVIKNKGTPYVVLLPHTTTIVETNEVIGVDKYIGGTLHSKVGVVAQGVGALGTMLGPNFAGHLMISLHNITDEVISIPVNDTFVSIVFHRLDTPSRDKNNPNISGHVDKLSELGISIDGQTREYLLKDWKCSVDTIRDQLTSSDKYKEYKSQAFKNKCKHFLKYLNLKNIVSALIIMVIVLGGGRLAQHLDANSASTIWTDRYWTVISASIIVPIITNVLKWFKAE